MSYQSQYLMSTCIPLTDSLLLLCSTTNTAMASTSAASATQVSSLLTPRLEVEPQVRDVKYRTYKKDVFLLHLCHVAG